MTISGAFAKAPNLRNPGIDLLRGIAIVLVVMHHLGLRIPLGHGILSACLPKWSINALIYNGYESVFIFFVISGFLIAGNCLTRWKQPANIHIRDFYVRRVARILPCMLILLTILSVLHLLGASDYVIAHPGQSLLRALFSALALHLNWYEGVTGYLPGNWDVLWSLSIEEVFYFAFPVLCLTLRGDQILGVAMALFALLLPLFLATTSGGEVWHEKAYLPGMAAIAMGVAGAVLAARVRLGNFRQISFLGFAGLAGLISVLFFEHILWPILSHGTMLVLTFSTLLMLLAFQWLARIGKLPALRGTSWLQSCGRLSYEIYLTHMFLIWPMVKAFKATGGNIWWGILWFVPTVALSWVLGALVAKFISVPCERAVRRFFTGDDDGARAIRPVPVLNEL